MSSTTTELSDLQRALTQLRNSVAAVRARYGDVPAVQRIRNDLERLDIDCTELSSAPAPAPRRASDSESIVVVPDTPYDPELWRDVDDEGLGGHHPHNH